MERLSEEEKLSIETYFNNEEYRKIAQKAKQVSKEQGRITQYSAKELLAFCLIPSIRNYDSTKSKFSTYLFQRIIFFILDEIREKQKLIENKRKNIEYYLLKNNGINVRKSTPSKHDVTLALFSLSDSERELITDVYFNNLKLKELIKKYNLHPRTIKSRINKIINKLREMCI